MDHCNVPLPKFLQVEVVGQCNLRCQMCPIQFRQDGPPHGPPAFMDFDLFERLLGQFPELERLQLQGLGEPMMHPRFFDMIELAVGAGDRREHQYESDVPEPAPGRALRHERAGRAACLDRRGDRRDLRADPGARPLR